MRTDPEAYNCETCVYRQKQEALDPENRRALVLWGRLARRLWLDHGGLTFALTHYTRDWDAEDVTDVIDRLAVLYDALAPPKLD